MSLYTDPLCLNKHNLFLELKNGLSGNIKDTRNILEIRDNVLYVWNANDSCVMTLNVAASREKDGDVLYQVSQQRSIIRFIDNLIGGEKKITRYIFTSNCLLYTNLTCITCIEMRASALFSIFIHICCNNNEI